MKIALLISLFCVPLAFAEEPMCPPDFDGTLYSQSAADRKMMDKFYYLLEAAKSAKFHGLPQDEFEMLCNDIRNDAEQFAAFHIRPLPEERPYWTALVRHVFFAANEAGRIARMTDIEYARIDLRACQQALKGRPDGEKLLSECGGGFSALFKRLKATTPAPAAPKAGQASASGTR